jgi:hypothetical protein
MGFLYGKLKLIIPIGILRKLVKHAPELAHLRIWKLGYLSINSHFYQSRVAPGALQSLSKSTLSCQEVQPPQVPKEALEHRR